MDELTKVLGVIGMVVAIAVLAVLGIVLVGPGVLLLLPVIVLGYGWLLWIFLHYRHCRQDELLHCLTLAAEAELPLAPALRAYLQDRPRGNVREFIAAAMLGLFPFPGYYWLWYRRGNYDSKVARVAQRIEQGVPLDVALASAPGAASRETIMAVAVGQASGKLAQCLRTVVPQRLMLSWLELLAPFGYPVPTLLLTIMLVPVILGFFVVYLLPKLQRIFNDFGIELPALTRQFVELSQPLAIYGAIALAGLLMLGVLLAVSSTLLWSAPGFGYVYRQHVRRRVLRMLSILLSVGRPIPDALGLMERLSFSDTVRWRLGAARVRVEHGEPLAESLLSSGLLELGQVPLIHASQRSGDLPWALAELSEAINNRVVRAVQHILTLLVPTVVVAVGAVVAFVVVSMFLPLVKIIAELSG